MRQVLFTKRDVRYGRIFTHGKPSVDGKSHQPMAGSCDLGNVYKGSIVLVVIQLFSPGTTSQLWSKRITD